MKQLFTSEIKIVLSILFIAIAQTGFSQSISYQLIEDNPDALSESFINVELLGIDYGANGTDGNVYVGGNIFWSVTDKLKAEGLLRASILNIKGSGFGIQS